MGDQSGKTMAPNISIIYFAIRARAECARMILAYGCIPYTDTDCQKHFAMSFAEAKKCGKLPFGQLPLLSIEDKTLLAQSGAIDRYLASLVNTPGFVPTDPVKRAECDMIYETVEDMIRIMPIVNVWTGEKWKQEKEEYFSKTLPGKLPSLVGLLGNKKYFCGNLVTYADFALYTIMDLIRLVEPNVIKKYSILVQWMARIESLPGVKDYLFSRPQCVGIGVSPRLQQRQ